MRCEVHRTSFKPVEDAQEVTITRRYTHADATYQDTCQIIEFATADDLIAWAMRQDSNVIISEASPNLDDITVRLEIYDDYRE
jgi:hypothetical protein